jgi:RNA polymerase sigma-70 factor (ECF subfamily)
LAGSRVLYDQYYRNVLRHAVVHAEPGAAEDMASEVFLITWRQLPAVPEQPFRGSSEWPAT